jgi:hypothetical protein
MDQIPFGVSWKVVFFSLRIVLVQILALLSERFMEVLVERDSLGYVCLRRMYGHRWGKWLSGCF